MYFRENITDGMSPLTVWAAHKCVIRGELIKNGAAKKREAEKELTDLT